MSTFAGNFSASTAALLQRIHGNHGCVAGTCWEKPWKATEGLPSRCWRGCLGLPRGKRSSQTLQSRKYAKLSFPRRRLLYTVMIAGHVMLTQQLGADLPAWRRAWSLLKITVRFVLGSREYTGINVRNIIHHRRGTRGKIAGLPMVRELGMAYRCRIHSDQSDGSRGCARDRCCRASPPSRPAARQVLASDVVLIAVPDRAIEAA